MSHLIRHRQLLAAATLFTLGTATQVAPAQERQVSTVMIIRCGPTDIILNSYLLEALLWEPGTASNLRKEFADDFKRVHGIKVNMPVKHGPGTFQVHIDGTISLAGAWDNDRREKATQAIVNHLRARLDDMLYMSPLMRLSERRDQLRNQHLSTSGRLVEMNALLEQSKHSQAAANSQLAALNNQFLAAKLAATTEEHVRQYLVNAREQNVAMRDRMRKSTKKAKSDHAGLNDELMDLVNRRSNATDRAASEKLTAKINRLQGQLDQATSGIARWIELTADAQNMLTIILEQLPTCELTLQRARAQQHSLQESMAEQSKRRAAAEQLAAKSATAGIKVAHLQIDSQVTREQLLDIEAQLARIRPVRYEVLQTR